MMLSHRSLIVYALAGRREREKKKAIAVINEKIDKEEKKMKRDLS